LALLLRSLCTTLALSSILCCAATPNGADQQPRIDPEIRRIGAAHPDSVVFILMRSTTPLRAEDRRALEKAGVTIGSVIGDVVTGRMRAGNVARLERLHFLAVAQLSKDIPVTSSRD
jgi:hypothetical protein